MVTAQLRREAKGGGIRLSFHCCAHTNNPQCRLALAGNLQLAPWSLPGIINISATLIKWQSRISSHSSHCPLKQIKSQYVLYCLDSLVCIFFPFFLLLGFIKLVVGWAERLAGQQVFASDGTKLKVRLGVAAKAVFRIKPRWYLISKDGISEGTKWVGGEWQMEERRSFHFTY